MLANISVRALTADDWETFSTIRLEALKENPSSFSSNYVSELKYTKEEWQDWLSQDVFGLFEGDNIAGIISVVTYGGDEEGKIGVICAVYIKPQYRGKGLSKLLYQACIDQAVKNWSWNKLIVSHREDNDVSKAGILRHGFVFTHNSSRNWPDGASVDEVCYELDLEQLRKKQ